MKSNISPTRSKVSRNSPGFESIEEEKDEEAGIMDDINDFFGRRLTEINELIAGKRKESNA